MSPALFDFDRRLQCLSDIGDQWKTYSEAVDFEIFRADLDSALGHNPVHNAGWPAA